MFFMEEITFAFGYPKWKQTCEWLKILFLGWNFFPHFAQLSKIISYSTLIGRTTYQLGTPLIWGWSRISSAINPSSIFPQITVDIRQWKFCHLFSHSYSVYNNSSLTIEKMLYMLYYIPRIWDWENYWEMLLMYFNN